MSGYTKKWAMGLLMILVVILSWVSSSFLLNQVFEENGYKKPFFITYLNVSSFVLYLVPIGIRKVLHRDETEEEDSIAVSFDEDEEEKDAAAEDSDRTALLPGKSQSQLPLTLRETAKLSGVFCALWFVANFSTNASLSYTSVASQTILSSTSSFFTLFIGAILHVESVNSSKLLGLLISFIGIICVTESDSITPDVAFSKVHVVIGNSLALLGALVYGLYSTVLKRTIRDESRINIKLFFGFVGLFTLVGLWPLLPLLHYTGIEPFELPETRTVVYLLLANGIITFASDYCWAKAILLTSPLTVTVGLSLTIPFAMAGDVLFKNKVISVWYVIGASLVLLSFALINAQEDGDDAKHLAISSADIECQTHESIYSTL